MKPTSPCPTEDPNHAAREMAAWFALPANQRRVLRARCAGDVGEYVRNGGTVAALMCFYCEREPAWEDPNGRMRHAGGIVCQRAYLTKCQEYPKS